MKTVFSVLVKIVLACSIVLTIWLLIANALNLENYYYTIPLLILGILSVWTLAPKEIWEKLYVWVRQRPLLIKAGLVIIIILSIAARFSFLCLDYNPTDNDPASFYGIAQSIAIDNSLGDKAQYVATFPYVLPYNVMLGAIMKVVGVGLLSVILLNTLLDLVSLVALYYLVLRVSRRRKTAILAGLLWVVSPFNIIFSALSLPVIAVNAGIVLSLLCLHFLITNLCTLRRIVPLSIVVGLLFAITNSLRPIMVIFVIALLCYYVLKFIWKPSKKIAGNLLISLLLVVGSYLSVNTGFLHIVSAVTGYPPTTNSGGWSIYVGANFETWGRWNIEGGKLEEVITESETLTAAHQQLRDEGIGRWLALGPRKALRLLLRKSTVLGGDQQHSVYDLASYPNFWHEEDVQVWIYTICALYSYALFVLVLGYLIRLYRAEVASLEFYHYLALTFVGLFLASLLVEVSTRYFMPFFTILTVFAAAALADQLTILRSKVDKRTT